jgi:protocatechuate 3,4-dioxygenase beta subunit
MDEDDEFRTIAAPYPGSHIPAHIHGPVAAPGYPSRWLAEYWFEGDLPLTPEQIAESAGQRKIPRDSEATERRCRRAARSA